MFLSPLPSPSPVPRRPGPGSPSARRGPTALAALALTLGLTGCASLPPGAAFAPVEQAARTHLQAEVAVQDDEAAHAAVRGRVDELLSRPLELDAAVQLALLHHRGLQADFAALGVARAELAQAHRLPNPGFSFGRFTRGDEVELERGWHLSLSRLLAQPFERGIAQRRFAQAQGEAAARVLAHGAQVREAWVRAVAAAQSLRYAEQVLDAADAGAELARRMAAVGNWSALQQAREQAFEAEARAGLHRARQQADATRERLVRLLGLWGPQVEALRLPERLPDLPATPPDRGDVEALALSQRLDVQGARLALERTARDLGLQRATRFVPVTELGWKHATASGEPRQTGWELGFEIPIFDSGDARVARAEARYREAAHRAAALAVDARSEAREAHATWRHAWSLAVWQRDQVLPLRQRIGEQNLLRYNGMLISVFELLADARAQVAAVSAAIDAQRDFWLADAALRQALTGPAGPGSALALSAAAAPAADAGGH
jgi:outer membrane protein TolC